MKRWSVIAALALSACAQSPSSPGGQAPSFRVDPNFYVTTHLSMRVAKQAAAHRTRARR